MCRARHALLHAGTVRGAAAHVEKMKGVSQACSLAASRACCLAAAALLFDHVPSSARASTCRHSSGCCCACRENEGRLAGLQSRSLASLLPCRRSLTLRPCAELGTRFYMPAQFGVLLRM